MAEYVATRRSVVGVLMLSGRAQIHYAVDDPFRQEKAVQALSDAIRRSGAQLEVLDYPGTGHLFTDPARPDEYDADSAALLRDRVLAFCATAPRNPELSQ